MLYEHLVSQDTNDFCSVKLNVGKTTVKDWVEGANINLVW